MAHGVARESSRIDDAGGVEHASAPVKRMAQALQVPHVSNHSPNSVPPHLPKHLRLPQLVQVLCKPKVNRSYILFRK